MMLVTKNTQVLKKNVGIIHSANNLTLLQRKVANALLYNAYNNLLTQEVHEIRISDLCKLIGYNSKDFKLIRKALMALVSVALEWNLLEKNTEETKEVWSTSAIIADADMDGSICTYTYSRKMRQLLYHPDIYGKINMEVQKHFKSTYGLALYENCIRYQNIQQTTWILLPVFRKLMGVGDERYPQFRDFKRRVLDVAVNEVNTYSPIFIVAEIKKQKRQVVAIRFLVKPSPKRAPAVKILKDKEKGGLSVTLMKEFGLSGKQTADMMQSYTQEYINEKIQVIQQSSSYQQGTIRNLAKYLLKALEDDYQQGLPAKTKQDSNKKYEFFEKVKKEKALIEDYTYYQYEWIKREYATLTTEKKALVISEFEKNMKDNVLYTVYQKEGLENILVSDRFCTFILQNFKDLLINHISFEEFCKQQQ